MADVIIEPATRVNSERVRGGLDHRHPGYFPLRRKSPRRDPQRNREDGVISPLLPCVHCRLENKYRSPGTLPRPGDVWCGNGSKPIGVHEHVPRRHATPGGHDFRSRWRGEVNGSPRRWSCLGLLVLPKIYGTITSPIASVGSEFQDSAHHPPTTCPQPQPRGPRPHI
jgi:hypothetical protein